MKLKELAAQLQHDIQKWIDFYTQMVTDLKETRPKLLTHGGQADCDNLIKSFEEKIEQN